MNITLLYPNNFHSTQTYQNSNFTFPHSDGLQLRCKNLYSWFFGINYIIPKYIKYSNMNFTGDIKEILTILENNDIIKILGCTFMRFKSLEEQLERIFDSAQNWKINNISAKYQNQIDLYITKENYYDLLIKIPVIINYIQIMIINIIQYTSIYYTIPIWVDQNIMLNLSILLKKAVDITTIDIDIGNVVYLIRIIPLIYDIYDYILEHFTIKM